MKYFTPERYLRLGNLDDKQAFLAAHEDWEQAVKEYAAHLRRLRDQLPVGLKRLVESVYLHDARVLGMWLGRVSRFTICLQPESDPSRLAVLTYSLLEAPTVNKLALPPESCSEPVAWLYDELSIQPATKKRSLPSQGTPIFIHDVLLSNGWELRLRFRDVTVARPVALIALVSRSA
jgi:hypothetical protein